MLWAERHWIAIAFEISKKVLLWDLKKDRSFNRLTRKLSEHGRNDVLYELIVGEYS